MDLARWVEVKEIVQQVLELRGKQRHNYIHERCGSDATLERDVRTLLAISSDDAAVFDDLHIAPRDQHGILEAGATVGPYTIVRPLGQGGMGAVYLAEHESSSQQVALKVLFSSASYLIAREGSVLHKKLRHPNIIQLYDIGTTEEGMHYLAMEFVDGIPITSYCQRYSLDLRHRLRLFVTIAHAVQYAHEHLVVHRDIKPSNILVTHHGESKLVDFGIAKIISDTKGIITLTSHNRPVTIAYASPEQINGDRTTVSTDIYSLGVLLCVLLTGRLPYDSDDVLDLPWMIRKEPPQKPSSLVGRSAHTILLESEATFRPPDDENLREHLRRLDPIVLRALEKQPERRYASVQAFADATQRYLDRWPAGRHTRHIGVGAACVVVSLIAFFLVDRKLDTAPKDQPLKQNSLMFQPGSEGHDMWYSSFYDQDSNHFVDDEKLRVGGWGDWYWSFIRFDLQNLPMSAHAVSFDLFPSYEGRPSIPVSMDVYVVESPWDEENGWSEDLILHHIGTYPPPVAGEWYSIIITELYNEWRSGVRENYGLVLKPTSNDNKFNEFRSSDYRGDPNERPRLMFGYFEGGIPYSVVLQRKLGQHLVAPHSPSLSVTNGLTLEGWFRASDPFLGAPLIGKWQLGSGQHARSYLLEYLEDELQLRLSLSDTGTNTAHAAVPFTFPSTTWTHIAVTYDTEKGLATFYVNGMPRGDTQELAISTIALTNADLGIGVSGGTNGEPARSFSGMIDDVRVWNIVRSRDDIFQSYLVETTGNELGLVGYWRLDGTGEDSSLYGNHLVLVNEPEFSDSLGVVTKRSF